MPKEAADYRYAQVPLELIEHPDTGPYEIAVYATLDSYVDRHSGECFPGVREIAGRARVHPNTVCSVVEKLVKLGFVQVIKRGSLKKKESNRYRLRRHMRSDDDEDPSSLVEGRHVTPDVTTRHSQSDITRTNNQNQEPNNPPNPPSQANGGLSGRAARRAALKAQREAEKQAKLEAQCQAEQERQEQRRKRRGES